MKIGDLAKLTGVSRDTIRLYERMELVKNVTRPYQFNNYKDYGEENVKRIRLILMMKKFGMTLKDCKMILDKMEEDNFDMEFQKTFVQQKIKEIDEQIKELEALKETLKKHVGEYCNQMRG